MLPDTPKVWLIGVHLIEEPKDPDEVERVEKGAMTAKSLVRSAKNEVSWIRFGKTYRVSKHANRGDSLCNHLEKQRERIAGNRVSTLPCSFESTGTEV